MKLSETAVILNKAATVLPNKTFSELEIKTWYELFQEMEPKMFYAGVLQALKTPGRKFFPTPGEVSEVFAEAKRLGEDSADEAWNSICELAQYGGKLSDSKACQAAKIIGWDRIRYEPLENLPFLKKEFVRVYERLVDREEFASSAVQIAHDKFPMLEAK